MQLDCLDSNIDFTTYWVVNRGWLYCGNKQTLKGVTQFRQSSTLFSTSVMLQGCSWLVGVTGAPSTCGSAIPLSIVFTQKVNKWSKGMEGALLLLKSFSLEMDTSLMFHQLVLSPVATFPAKEAGKCPLDMCPERRSWSWVNGVCYSSYVTSGGYLAFLCLICSQL